MAHPPELHVRAVADLEMRDTAQGLVVEGLVFPYNREADIVEARGAGSIAYREAMAPRCAERNFRAPHRIGLQYNHDGSFDARLGYATELRESGEGLVVAFRLDPSRADHARDILGGSHGGLSVAFISLIPKPLTERAGELVVRRSIHIDHIAATPTPAYDEARVLALREEVGDGHPTANEVEYAARKAQQDALLAWVATARTLPEGYAAVQ